MTEITAARRPRPKYQIFVSSTFTDLREEREAVIWHVFKMRHIPVGMEAFPAADDRGWSTIQRIIDSSDYYVLIIGGRYGTVDMEMGISWTEREYNYAIERGIPVLSFIRKSSANTEDKLDTGEPRAKLQAFKARVQGAHQRKEWEKSEDLVTEVAEALRSHFDDDEDSDTPRPGWYRGTDMPPMSVASELARLSAENEQLRSQASVRKSPDLLVKSPDVRRLGKMYVGLRFDVFNQGTDAAHDVSIDVDVQGANQVRLVRMVGGAASLVDPRSTSLADSAGACSFAHARRGEQGWMVRQQLRTVRVGSLEPVDEVAFGGLGGRIHVTVHMADSAGHSWSQDFDLEPPPAGREMSSSE